MNSEELLQAVKAGQNDAATAIYDRYVARLIALARRRIGPKLKRRIDAEDVVQSAYRSFFVHAREDRYALANSGDLWRLLASITLNKLYGQTERNSSAKRSLDREQAADLSPATIAAPEPSAQEVAAAGELLQLAIADLSPLECAAFASMLDGQSVKEIAVAIGKSERTARRLLADVRHKIERCLLANDTDHSDDPPAPLQYADYVLEQLLGAGGMGKVFRAREKRTGKAVAIKALHKAKQSDRRAVARFVQEAQILARLRHQNIVGVQGLGRFPGGGYFMAIDYVEGTDLERRLRQGRVPLQEAIRIVKIVAAAIAHAHDQGVVHCDLKPGNVLLGANGGVFVTDFGFAHLVAGESPSAASGIGGTAGYIAPEILSGQSPPSPAADVYALGALLSRLTAEEPLAVVVSICRRCLADDPKERYRSAKELVKDLDVL